MQAGKPSWQLLACLVLLLTSIVVWIIGILLLGLVTARMLDNLEMIIDLAGM